MTKAALAPLDRVHAIYDALADDVAALDARPIADPVLSAEAALFLHAEARMLDRRRFEDWGDLWSEDGWFWVPLRTDSHPARDQGLVLDDHRRIGERVWRMRDTSAWALFPAAETVRAVSGVEAWDEGADGLLVASVLALTHVRTGRTTELAGRQVHRLRRTASGLRITRKILLIPRIAAGVPHLGWLL